MTREEALEVIRKIPEDLNILQAELELRGIHATPEQASKIADDHEALAKYLQEALKSL